MKKSQQNGNSFEKAPFPVWLRLSYLVVIPAIITGGFLFYKDQSQQLKSDAESNLKAVAQLKVSQIVQWWSERMGDAYLIMENTDITSSLNSPQVKSNLLRKFKSLKEHYFYRDVLLADSSGKILSGTGDCRTHLDPGTLNVLRTAFENKKPEAVDLYYNTFEKYEEIDIVVPLLDPLKSEASPKGAIVLCINARQYLYPLIQAWPMPSQTSETLLVRKEGNSVLFLNDLRHRGNTALKFSISLSHSGLPASVAVNGKQGVYEGMDYRGVKVLSYLQQVPGKPWYMVSKIDVKEAFALARFRGSFIFILTLMLVIVVFTVLLFLWKHGRQIYYKALYQKELDTQALRKHFEYLVKYANDIILLADKDYRIMELNDRACEEYGYSRDEMLTLTLKDFVAQGDRMHYQERLNELKEKGSYIREGVHQRKDGSVFPVEISGRYIEIDNSQYYQSIVRNITERKEIEDKLNNTLVELNIKYSELKAAEEELSANFEEIQAAEEELAIQNEELQISKERAEESDRLKTAFLQNMSHEIRTPMNAIMGFSQLLKENMHDPDKLMEFSEIINRRGSDLLAIIDEILEVSRIETGQLRVMAKECDMNLLLDELYTFFVNYKSQMHKGHITISCRKMEEADPVILTDIIKFKQIFINLIQNALKYTERGSVQFGFEKIEDNNLLFFVSDTGKGIPKDKYHKIFERFMQIDTSQASIREGLGLGLAIVKGLVTLLGGKIWVKSEIGQGSEFYFTIPNRPAVAKADPFEPLYNRWPDESSYHWENKTFLIVEDDFSSREYLKELLDRKGAKLLFARTGAEAVDTVLMDIKIDLVLLDLRLPDINGIEIVETIKKMKPATPIIAQTAFAMESDREKCLSAGCDAFIAKPVLPDELYKLISDYIVS